MRPVVLALALLLALPAAASASVRTTWRTDDAQALAVRLLDDPEWRSAADARGTFAFEILIVGGERATFVYDGELGRSDARAEATVALTASAALVALNAEEPTRTLRCLLDAGAIAVTPRTPAERVVVRAYRAQMEADCAPPEGAVEIAPGVHRLGARVFDAFGTPLGWQDGEASVVLGRAEAGISRLAPDALPRATAPDLADPWLAPLALRDALDRAMDCPCAPVAELLPPGDWRAATEADPRAGGGA